VDREASEHGRVACRREHQLEREPTLPGLRRPTDDANARASQWASASSAAGEAVRNGATSMPSGSARTLCRNRRSSAEPGTYASLVASSSRARAYSSASKGRNRAPATFWRMTSLWWVTTTGGSQGSASSASTRVGLGVCKCTRSTPRVSRRSSSRGSCGVTSMRSTEAHRPTRTTRTGPSHSSRVGLRPWNSWLKPTPAAAWLMHSTSTRAPSAACARASACTCTSMPPEAGG
jgi:hypothetical protein